MLRKSFTAGLDYARLGVGTHGWIK